MEKKNEREVILKGPWANSAVHERLLNASYRRERRTVPDKGYFVNKSPAGARWTVANGGTLTSPIERGDIVFYSPEAPLVNWDFVIIDGAKPVRDDYRYLRESGILVGEDGYGPWQVHNLARYRIEDSEEWIEQLNTKEVYRGDEMVGCYAPRFDKSVRILGKVVRAYRPVTEIDAECYRYEGWGERE